MDGMLVHSAYPSPPPPLPHTLRWWGCYSLAANPFRPPPQHLVKLSLRFTGPFKIHLGEREVECSAWAKTRNWQQLRRGLQPIPLLLEPSAQTISPPRYHNTVMWPDRNFSRRIKKTEYMSPRFSKRPHPSNVISKLFYQKSSDCRLWSDFIFLIIYNHRMSHHVNW